MCVQEVQTIWMCRVAKYTSRVPNFNNTSRAESVGKKRKDRGRGRGKRGWPA